ncbi:hypothetical protein K438DRAFT_1996496 [Mycena galopus ATCC 62051]|nr:hypothetical protein K438DRAFT_1996496 [Mycena galopus ATCC 62051]
MSAPTFNPAVVASLEAAIKANLTVKYCCFAGIAWMVYDILINLHREVKHFWFGKWFFPRVLYFLNRYFSLARVVFYVFGTASIYVQTWTGAFEVWFLQIILIYRVNSLYRTKKILIAIIFLFLCSVAGVTTIITKSVGASQAAACMVGPHHVRLGAIWAFWVPILAFESVLFVLALFQLVRNIGMFRKNALLFQSNSHLIELILRDSIWYFLVVCLVDITSLVLWQSPHVPAGTEWTTGFTSPLFSIIGTRLLLNLREYGDVMEYTSSGGRPNSNYHESEPRSAIGFAGRTRAARTTFGDSSTRIRTPIPHVSDADLGTTSSN